MISILIPTYNYNSLPLVQAIYDQMEKLTVGYEIIVFDDASTQPFQENERINLLENCTYQTLESNIGRSAIRNKLAQIAKFETLLFLDADVLPENANFMQTYVKYANSNYGLICGGIKYSSDKPPKQQMLRYVYGIKREVKNAVERNKNKYTIVSANIFTTKDCFFKMNTALTNFYGSDLLISHNLKKDDVNVIHIDNPVIHLGLESSSNYIKKSLEAVKTISMLENIEKFESRFFVARSKLKRLYLLRLFQNTMKTFSPLILTNLKSGNPNIFLFDLYRLFHYNIIKNNA